MTDRTQGPSIEGLTFIEHLGTGGYSDVYLYQSHKPRMRVAVKVLTDERRSDNEIAQFAAEADAMAEVADHHNIVQVFSTGVTDAGRPYLVMKYYPGSNLALRAASERFTVAEVLRTGIQIAGAVDTAHRAGILHRDIKPSNILQDKVGSPGLADFGIAGKAGDTDDDDELSVSIPWSPPEVLSAQSNGSIASDVYSLAATLWHLLAGRSPYEVPGGDNSRKALTGRILSSSPKATGRADAPRSLERLLQQAMSKHPHHRPETALAFGRALQAVEQELRYSRTELISLGDDDGRPVPATAAAPAPPAPAPPAPAPRAPVPPAPTPVHAPEPPADLTAVAPARPAARDAFRPTPKEEPRTTVRPLTPTMPAQPAAPAPVAPTPAASPTPTPTPTPNPVPAPASRAGGRERVPLSAEAAEPQTSRRPLTPSADETPLAEASVPEKTGGLRSPVAIGIAAIFVLLVVVVGVVITSGGDKKNDNEPPKDPIGDNVGGFDDEELGAPAVTASVNGKKVTFRWKAPEGAPEGVRFSYFIRGGATVAKTSATSKTVRTSNPETACISVIMLLPDGDKVAAREICGG